MIGSDNVPDFTSQVSQGIATALGTDWKLHCAYRAKNSGQEEGMNRKIHLPPRGVHILHGEGSLAEQEGIRSSILTGG